MSEDWAGVASEVAGAYGEVSENTATLIVITTTGGNGTPTNPGTIVETTYEASATEAAFSWDERQSTAIQQGDLKLSTAVFPIQPDTSMKIEWAGRRYQIISAKPLRPDGVTAIKYALHLRP